MNHKRALIVAVAVIIILATALVYVRSENAKLHSQVDDSIGLTVGEVLDESGFPSQDSRLWVYGNANEDDRINADDISYLRDVIAGLAEPTVLSDANCDGTVDADDIAYVQRIIDSDRMDVFYIDNYYTVAKVSWPVNSIAIGYCTGAYAADLAGICGKVAMVDNTIKDYWYVMNDAFADAESFGTTESPNYERMMRCEIDVYVVGYCDQTADPQSPEQLNPMGIDVMFITTADNAGVDYPNEHIDRSLLMFAYLLQGDMDKVYRYLDWHDTVLGALSSAAELIPADERESMIMARSSLLYSAGTISITGKDNTNNIHAEWVGVNAVGQHSPLLSKNYQDLTQEQLLTLIRDTVADGLIYYVDNEHGGIRNQYALKDCLAEDRQMLSSSVADIVLLGMAREAGNSPLYIVELAFYQNVMYPELSKVTGLDYRELFEYYFENFSSEDYAEHVNIDDFFLVYGRA